MTAPDQAPDDFASLLEAGETVLWTGSPAISRVRQVTRTTLLRGAGNIAAVILVCAAPVAVGLVPVAYVSFVVLLAGMIVAIMGVVIVRDIRQLRAFRHNRYIITDRRLIKMSMTGQHRHVVSYRKGVFAQVSRRTWRSLSYFFIAIQAAGGEKIELATLDAIADADTVEPILRRVLL